MSDEPDVIESRWAIGPWMASGFAEGEAPHRRHGEPRVSLSAVWADTEQTTPVAVEDWDGCTAIVRRRES